MRKIDEAEFNHFIHNVSLHAELGKMLIEDKDASTEQIKNAFEVILLQCKHCDQTINEMRKGTNKTPELKK
jgi:hypothetical protein